MAEYIKRDAVKKAFEYADADVCEDYGDGFCDWGFGRKNVNEIIDAVPAVDAVPVVRCKDCLYWEAQIGFCHQNSQYYNDGESWDIYQPDEFCSRGERRTT